MIAGILPPGAVAAESAGPLPRADLGLFPAESLVVGTAGPRRRAEFAAGRRCARVALAGLGLAAVPVLPGPAGQPRWPAGVTGSITHCPGYRACAVARTADLAGLGIDAEPDEELPAGLISAVTTGAGRDWLRRQAAAGPAVHWDRLVFSAQEAAAKCWYPLTGQWPERHDLAVTATAAGTLTVRVAIGRDLPGRLAAGGRDLPGRWLARDGLILTVVSV